MVNFLTSGESHGKQLTVIIDGFPAGYPFDLDKLNFQLARRQKGYGRGGRMKIETDRVEILSGIRNSKTLGSPITFAVKNKDWENWTKIMHPVDPISADLNLKEKRLAYETTYPRPGHADLSGGIKFNHKDFRNILERASARETAARVAVGSLLRQFMEYFDIQIASHVVSIGSVELPGDYKLPEIDELREITENSEVRCVDKEIEAKMIAEIKDAKKKRDSLGGVAEIIVKNLPAGLGGFSQPEQRLDSLIAAAIMAVPSVKGFEIGLGFQSAKIRGSDVHDEIFYKKDSNPRKKDFFRKTNNAGGIEGGMTNGEDLIIRAAAKPISTLNKPLQTVDVLTKKACEAMVERTDNCVVPAMGVVSEAAIAIVMANAFMNKFGSDNLSEIETNFQNYLKTEY
ncbi:MAG: chorismate synthase [Calditrichaeota bacterium]|nr:MAG: chorismate synthase [Calditrichota bacterium]